MSETRLDAVMREIETLGYGSPEYHEAMWFLLSVMARRQAMIAESIRSSRRDSARRRKRAAETRARKAAVEPEPVEAP